MSEYLTDEDIYDMCRCHPADDDSAHCVHVATLERIVHRHRAEAWDEGYNAGKNDLRDGRVFSTTNPYREKRA